MAADHAFTMTRSPRDMTEIWLKSRGTRGTTRMVKQQEDKQKGRTEVVNFERRWWLKRKEKKNQTDIAKKGEGEVKL